MQPVDPKLNEAVWNRVLAAAPAACPAAPPSCPATMTAEEILSYMQGEKNDCATYRYLSCKACGCDAAALKAIAQDEACHFKKLHALYFLLSGKCVCMDPQKPACVPCLTEALRTRYNAEMQDAVGYENAAVKWPDMAHEFHCIAADERAHAAKIVCILQNRL